MSRSSALLPVESFTGAKVQIRFTGVKFTSVYEVQVVSVRLVEL